MLFQEQIFIATIIATLLEGITGTMIKFFTNAVNKGWITVEQAEEIREAKIAQDLG